MNLVTFSLSFENDKYSRALVMCSGKGRWKKTTFKRNNRKGKKKNLYLVISFDSVFYATVKRGLKISV